MLTFSVIINFFAKSQFSIEQRTRAKYDVENQVIKC